jgi:imidazoleglycerol-phosphate dehydratase/histidinol-phosphatase
MKKVLFIDRDGTLVKEPYDEQLDSLEKLEFYPFVFQSLANICNELDYELVMVTNQDGLGTNSFPEEDFWSAQNKIIEAFSNEGIRFSEILIDKSFPHENAPTRKPGIGMLSKYIYGNYDLENSYIIGDRLTDVQLAKNLNCKSIYIHSKPSSNADFNTTSWKEIYKYLAMKPRCASIVRKTSETSIEIELCLDGNGKTVIETGLGFFDHMLEQIGKHGYFDLNIKVLGDLNVDEHHTIEDVGIALGEAFYKALGNKKGIERYGFLLPMDDSLAQIALDFGGRSHLVWNAAFNREKIGEMPTEMFKHFFKSFSDSAKCNINITAVGENEHHKIEGIFKAFAKTLKMSVSKNNTNTIPSTKGIL